MTRPLLLTALLAACAGRPAPRSAHGMHDQRVVLTGDAAHAEGDAAVITTRIQRMGYPGAAKAVRGEIEVTLPMPSGVSPRRIIDRVIEPGELSIHNEVAINGKARVLQDCTAGAEACQPVAIGPALLTSAHVARAELLPNGPHGGLAVLVEFNPEGARLIEQATANLMGRRLVIQVDDVVLSRPVVHTPITGGEAVIHIGPAVWDLQIDHAANLVERIQGPPLQGAWQVADAR